MHGTADERVAYHNALDIVTRAGQVGVPVEFHPLEGVGHDVWTPDSEQIMSWMSFFLYRLLVPSAVGGIAEAPETAASPLESGGSSASHDGLAGVAAAGVVVISAVGWYVQRRYSVRRR